MPPKKIRVIPRHAAPEPEPTPGDPTAGENASARPKTIIERLRERTSYLDAAELAEILGYQKNVKRVYALPIPRVSLGEGGERALRWDPADVADYLEKRRQEPGSGEQAA